MDTLSECCGAAGEEQPPYFVRAVNPDNKREVASVFELLSTGFGGGAPSALYRDGDDPAASVRRSLRSGNSLHLVAVDSSRLIAHIALARSPSATEGHVFLPAVHPEHRSRLFEVMRLLWACLRDHASRQRLRQLLHFIPAGSMLHQAVTTRCFNSHAVAILPCHGRRPDFGLRTGASVRGSVALVMCHILGQERSAPGHANLYPPASRCELIRHVYTALGSVRGPVSHDDRTSSGTSGVSPSLPGTGCPAREGNASATGPVELEIRLFRGLRQVRAIRIALLRGAPDEASSTLHELEAWSSRHGGTVFVQVPLTDPRCPAISCSLEEQGYRVCGLIPGASGWDFLAHARFRHDELLLPRLFSGDGRRLCNQVLHHPGLN